MHFARMVNMAKSPEEVKKEVGDYPMPAEVSSKPSVPVYPWGLCLRLDESVLKKLGLDGDLPEVGDIVHFCAQAKVTSVSENESEKSDGTKQRCCNVELQITDLGVPAATPAEEAEEAAEHRRNKWYGGADADAA
jgi:hypothetical protein